MFGRIIELINRLIRFERDEILDADADRNCGPIIHYLKPGQRLNYGKYGRGSFDNPENTAYTKKGKNEH